MSSSCPGASGSHGAARPPPGPSDNALLWNQGGKSFLKSALYGACCQNPGPEGRDEDEVALSRRIKKKVNSEPSRGRERKRGGEEGEERQEWERLFVSDKDRENEAEVGETESRFKSKQMEERWNAKNSHRERPGQQGPSKWQGC